MPYIDNVASAVEVVSDDSLLLLGSGCQAVHQLNGALLQAQSLVEAEAMGVMAATPQIVTALIALVTSGEPHAYIALNALHFVAFCPEAWRLMVGLAPLTAIFAITDTISISY
jgi:hypothetical protein